MRIKRLELKNIGPFQEGYLEFISSEEQMEYPPVVFITGENGTGKSIIIDSIRAILNGRFGGGIERDITSSETFSLQVDIRINEKNFTVKSNSKFKGKALETDSIDLSAVFISHLQSKFKRDFIFDYWTSKLSNDSFDISNISSLEVDKYLDNSILGVHQNVDLTRIISFFDYLKDSKDDDEKNLGQSLYEILEEMINLSITNGFLSHVSRIDLKPMVKIGDRNVTLDKLSSGNIYLIQRFVSLLGQVYSICVINKIPISDFKNIEGLLLIDEAENHLHPKWQKVFLQNILEIFPKLQLIVSTHSPFIVSSINNCKVFVCKGQDDYSIINEETDYYSNKPIEEILLSPLFNTSNFNKAISDLLQERKLAISSNDLEEAQKIEARLLQENPEYFNYLNIENLLKSFNK